LKSTFGVVSIVGVALVAAACGSDSATSPKPPVGADATCVVGTLTVGTTVTGDVSNTASSCLYPLFWDSAAPPTSNVSYNFGVRAGKGYLISEIATWNNHVQLIGGTTAAKVTLAEADYGGVRQSTLAFVATSTTAYSVRVGADDNNNPADTGTFTLRAQSCKVPVPTITNSVTHSDNLASGDCTVPQGDFNYLDSSYVHLYAIHFDSGGTRTITFGVPGAALAFDLGGPGYDPYGYLWHSSWTGKRSMTTDTTITFTAGDSGVYTMMVGTAAYQAASTAYTLTVGTEVPAPLHVTRPPGMSNSSVLKARKHGQ
jgi:hypothetical protein